jgi:hypothetical protein
MIGLFFSSSVVNRAAGLPARAITTSVPPESRSTSLESCVFAS